jgi:hypothetical protein
MVRVEEFAKYIITIHNLGTNREGLSTPSPDLFNPGTPAGTQDAVWAPGRVWMG